MPQAQTLRIDGYRLFLQACARAEKGTARRVRERFRQTGEIVRAEWAQRFASVDARSAAGYRVHVRQRGVSVEQSLRKTTGRHPEYGALQMRFGIGVLTHRQRDVELDADRALDDIANDFDRA